MLSRMDENEPFMSIVPQTGFDIGLVNGDADSGRGVTSPGFGQLETATQIVLRGTIQHCNDKPSGSGHRFEVTTMLRLAASSQERKTHS